MAEIPEEFTARAAVQEVAISTPVTAGFMVEITRRAWFTCFLSL